MTALLESRIIGKSHAWTVGTGEPLIVIHGGPGLEHTYLVDWLLPLSKKRTLIFYDQLGCGVDKTPPGEVTADALAEQLEFIIESIQTSIDGRLGFITHSWGAYLLYRIIQMGYGNQLHPAVLISPVGLTRARFEDSGKRLMKRIPEEVVKEAQRLATVEGDDTAVMRALYPYYMDENSDKVVLQFGSYNEAVYEQIMSSLGDYDYRSIGPKLPKSTVLIYGDQDIEIAEATKEIRSYSSLYMIKNSGHFSFAEQPKDFIDIITSSTGI